MLLKPYVLWVFLYFFIYFICSITEAKSFFKISSIGCNDCKGLAIYVSDSKHYIILYDERLSSPDIRWTIARLFYLVWSEKLKDRPDLDERIHYSTVKKYIYISASYDREKITGIFCYAFFLRGCSRTFLIAARSFWGNRRSVFSFSIIGAGHSVSMLSKLTPTTFFKMWQISQRTQITSRSQNSNV